MLRASETDRAELPGFGRAGSGRAEKPKAPLAKTQSGKETKNQRKLKASKAQMPKGASGDAATAPSRRPF
jgi:hypothetical protein